MCRAGFEPAPPKRKELESSALDHSANDTNFNIFLLTGPTEIRTRVSRFKVLCANLLHYGTKFKKCGPSWVRTSDLPITIY